MSVIRELGNKVKRRITPAKYKWSQQKLYERLMVRYETEHGNLFDIDHPVLFTEKMQWYMLYYKDQRIPKIVDKYDFKGYIAQQLGEGYTIPLIGVYNDVSEIERAWPGLPEEFCLKSTISSNGRNIKVIRKKAEVDFNNIRTELKTWFDPKNTMLNSYCTGYYTCRPRVIAEQYMENIAGQLCDYKVFCFHGEPFCIYAAMDHFTGEDHQNGYPISFYDFEWNRLDVRYGAHVNADIPKPKYLQEMVALAKVLSADFPFVRVDFFDTDTKLYVAELTFYPGGGLSPYQPVSFNKAMGDMFVLPIDADGKSGE